MNIIKSAAKFIKVFIIELKAIFVKASIHFLPSKCHQIYDCFLFNNELDLLRIRLSSLYSYVDHFILLESSTTFAGEDKELFYLKNKHLFEEFNDKIIHYIIPKPPPTAFVSNPANPGSTTCQFWQRNQIAEVIRHVDDNDLVIVSDLDEIPNSRSLRTIYKICYYADRIAFFSQSWHLLFLNVRVNHKPNAVFKSRSILPSSNHPEWLGSFAGTARRIRNKYNSNVNGIWALKWGAGFLSELIVCNSGWHLSYMGGAHSVIAKMNSNGMRPLSDNCLMHLKNGNFCGATLKIDYLSKDYPEEILFNPDKWKHLMMHDQSFEQLAERIEARLI